MSPLFEGSLINNTELRDILTRTKCMAIAIRAKELQRNRKKIKIRMFWDYLIKCLYLQKINLKRPVSRGNHFKIYFRLECRGNRKSRQNFHWIPILKDSMLINSNHSIPLPLYAYIKRSNNLNLRMNVKNILRKLTVDCYEAKQTNKKNKCLNSNGEIKTS